MNGHKNDKGENSVLLIGLFFIIMFFMYSIKNKMAEGITMEIIRLLIIVETAYPKQPNKPQNIKHNITNVKTYRKGCT